MRCSVSFRCAFPRYFLVSYILYIKKKLHFYCSFDDYQSARLSCVRLIAFSKCSFPRPRDRTRVVTSCRHYFPEDSVFLLHYDDAIDSMLQYFACFLLKAYECTVLELYCSESHQTRLSCLLAHQLLSQQFLRFTLLMSFKATSVHELIYCLISF